MAIGLLVIIEDELARCSQIGACDVILAQLAPSRREFGPKIAQNDPKITNFSDYPPTHDPPRAAHNVPISDANGLLKLGFGVEEACKLHDPMLFITLKP